MKKIQWIAGILLLALAGCTTSNKITTTWKAENITVQKYNKIMMVGLIKDTDRSVQEKMENHLAGDLKDLGYNAVSSLQEYGPRAFDKMDEPQVLEKLKSSGVDAVITIVLLDKQRERKYVPSSIHYSPYGYYHNRFGRYYGTMQQRIYEPGYYVTDTKYFWESNFYDLHTQELIYSAQTNSFDPASTENLGHEYGKTIVKDMVKQNVLIKQ